MSQLSAAAFSAYDPSQAAAIMPGPLALYTVAVGSIDPTQLNEGYTEVGKKAAGDDLLTPSQLQASLLASIEPVVIGPGGQLYLTDGHHTFTALDDSIYGTGTTVYVNVIANYSALTTSQFFSQMQSANLLLPLNEGVAQPVDAATGAPIPTSLTGLTNDPYRGLEYSILKNKSSKLFTTTSNITGATGSSIAGLDKMTGFYSDFLEAAAYRTANNGLGLPFLSPGDVALATQWNLNGTSAFRLPNVAGTVTAAQLPGFILAQNLVQGGTIGAGVISNATLANGALDGNGTFTGITTINAGTAANPITIGTPNTGFILQLGADRGYSVTLNAANTYTGGTSLLAGTLVITSDAALGAAATGATIDTANLKASVQASNGIVFNSLSEGNATLQIGTAAGGGTATFATNRVIAIGGETATINLNGYNTTLTGQLYSLGVNGVGIGNATGFSDLTIDDTGANKGVLTLSTASPNFYGNLIIGGNNKPTVRVMSDAALGNTTGNANLIGQIVLNGGTLQAGASFAASERNLSLTSGSTIDTAGFSTSWGALSDTQRVLTITNSAAGAGSATFASLTIGAAATLALTKPAGSDAVTFAGGIVRSGAATLILQPAANSLGATEMVFSAGQSATNVGGIAPAWIVTNNGTAAGPYDFVSYNAASGYGAASYGSTTLSSATGSTAVKLSSASTTTGNLAAYALNTNGKAVTIAATSTLTIGDGTPGDAAGLILAAGSAIAGGTLAFGGSEAVITTSGSSAAISSTITGSNGLTFSGAGTVAINTAVNVSGQITIDSSTVTLGAVNVFAGDTSGILLNDTKSTPAAAVLAIAANNVLATLNSVGSNSTVTISGSAMLTIGDSTNQSSTLSSTITESGSGVAGALTKAGTGLLDISGAKLSLTTGGTVAVTAGALRTSVGTSGSANYVLSNNADLQFAQNGGGKYSGAVTGSGTLHLIGGTLQLTGTANSYTGGTIVETGSILDVTTANISTGNANITDAGGLVVFDQATSGTYGGIISDGRELGSGPILQGSLDKDDSSGANGGNLTLSSVQTYTGATYVEAGTLTLGVTNAVASSSGITLGRVGGAVGTSATVTLALGANETVNALSSNAGNTTAVTLNGFVLTVAPTTGISSTFGGAIVDGSSAGSFVKTGAGTLILSGANQFTGGTTLSAGTLELASASAAGASGPGTAGSIAFTAGANATLRIDAAGLNAKSQGNAANDSFANTITGFQAGATLDLTGLADAYGGTATLVGTTLTVGDATDGYEYLTDFAGPQGSYRAASDGAGGTLVTFAGPAITAVAVSGAGIAADGSGDLGAGHSVTFTLTTSEAVTVSGASPTLALNDGGVATYSGGSGTSNLTFSYVVAAGDNTGSLQPTGVNANGATIVDGAGTGLDVSSLATAAKPSGALEIDTTAPAVSSPSLSVAANSPATPIGITAPSDVGTASAASLTIKVSGLPNDGVVTLADGATAVTAGEILSSTQLTGLEFTPTADISGTASTFSYVVTDAAGNSSTGTATLTIPATAPTISGTVSNQQTTSEAPLQPFSTAVVHDRNVGASETLTITLGGSGGTLTGVGLSGGTNGVYTLAGSAANVTSMLEGLSFTPNASGGSSTTTTTATTTFALSDVSSAYSAATNDTTTSVVDTDPAKAPIISISSPAGGAKVSIIDPTISGTVDVADAGSTVTVTSGQTVLGSATVAGNGAWSVKPTFAGDGSYTVTASDTNAGGTGSGSTTFTIDSTPNQNLFGAVTHDVTSVGGDITALYQTILGRAPDPLGLEGWAAAEAGGTPLASIAQSFLGSAEYASDYGTSVQSDSAFVNQLYLDGLHRNAEPSGLAGWDNALANGTSRAQVAVDIATSQESHNDLAPTFQAGVFVPNGTDSAIARLYYGLLDRAPDASGLQNWEGAVAGGASLDQVAQGFLSSAEYGADHGTPSNADFVNQLYEGALGRAASDPGAQGWVAALNNGATRSAVTLGVAESQEAANHLTPAIEGGYHIA